jgi:hypothetical protein
MNCPCGQPLKPATGKGRPSVYCSERCANRYRKQRERSNSREDAAATEQEEIRALGAEMSDIGKLARMTHHPMQMAGVLIALYRDASSEIEKIALAYVFSLLVESYRSHARDVREDGAL